MTVKAARTPLVLLSASQHYQVISVSAFNVIIENISVPVEVIFFLNYIYLFLYFFILYLFIFI